LALLSSKIFLLDSANCLLIGRQIIVEKKRIMNKRAVKDTRQFILDTAENLILTRGYNGFSYKDIAEVVGIRKASIHYHFPTKEALGVVFVERYVDRFQNWCEFIAGQTATQKLASFLEMFKLVSDNAEQICPMGMLTAEYPTLPLTVQDKLRRLYGEMDQWLTKVLIQGRTEGSLKFTPEPTIMAKVMLNAMSASLKMARVFQDVDQLEAVFNALMTMIRMPGKRVKQAI
jgi:TetR/AcrR family transcriptional repressor of nem operon